jgi:hypothetical protein
MRAKTQMSKYTMVPIIGNTYPIKEKLKAMGGKWNSRDKVWTVPAHREEEALTLLPSSSFGSRSRRSGGMCEDAPCCGCCGPQGDGDYYGSQGDY